MIWSICFDGKWCAFGYDRLAYRVWHPVETSWLFVRLECTETVGLRARWWSLIVYMSDKQSAVCRYENEFGCGVIFVVVDCVSQLVRILLFNWKAASSREKRSDVIRRLNEVRVICGKVYDYNCAIISHLASLREQPFDPLFFVIYKEALLKNMLTNRLSGCYIIDLLLCLL